MSKYIDLAETIHEGTRYKRVKPALILIRGVLEWLDDHPDQVPGRMMTESELYAAANVAGDSGEFDVEEFARQVGITVEDPEPTNAEKLAGIIAEKFQLEYRGDPNDAIGLGKYLDEAGVKAPGGEDD